MGNFLLMPKLGAAADAKLIRWIKEEGDRVYKGECVLEVETEKTSFEVDAQCDGVLLKQYHEEGDDVLCDTEIGYIGEAGEEAPAPPEK